MPKVSVIIPVYGVEKYIARCAESLFQQSLNDIEYLFVDDCSEDRSIDILNDVIRKYHSRLIKENKSVQILRQPVNSGQSAVRREGTMCAKGDFVIHCDSDDWVECDFLELLYNKAIETNADLVMCDFWEEKPEKSIVYHQSLSGDMMHDFFSERIVWSVWNKLVSRKLFDSSFVYAKSNMGEDMIMTLQYIIRANHIEFIDKPLYHYVYNPMSISNLITEDKILNRYHGAKENIDTAIDMLEKFGYDRRYAKMIDFMKYHVRRYLNPLLQQKKYFTLWLSTYPEINRTFIFNHEIRFKTRCHFFLIISGLYRICPNLFK